MRTKCIFPSWKSQEVCGPRLVQGLSSIKFSRSPSTIPKCGSHLQGLSQQLCSRQQGGERNEKGQKACYSILLRKVPKSGHGTLPLIFPQASVSSWPHLVTGRLGLQTCSSFSAVLCPDTKSMAIEERENVNQEQFLSQTTSVQCLLPSPFNSLLYIILSIRALSQESLEALLDMPDLWKSLGKGTGIESKQENSAKFSILPTNSLSIANIQEEVNRQVLEHIRGKIEEGKKQKTKNKNISQTENRDHTLLYAIISLVSRTQPVIQ